MEIFLFAAILPVVIGNGHSFQNYTSQNVQSTKSLNIDTFHMVKELVLSSSMKHIRVITSNKLSDEVPLLETFSNVPVTLLIQTVEFFYQTTGQIMQNVLADENLTSFWKRLNFVVIATSPEIEDVLLKAHQLDVEFGTKCLLRHFSRWILIPTHDRMSRLFFKETLFDNINVVSKTRSPLTDIVGKSWITLYTLMWESAGRVLRVNEQYLKTGQSPFPNVNYGLNGRRISVAMLEWIPFSRKETSLNGTVMYSGISGDILMSLSVVFNFSIRYVEPQDQQWGIENNRSWTGIIAMLKRQEADMCGVPFGMNPKRMSIMAYSYPFRYSYQSAVYRTPGDKAHSWTVLTACFKWEVYMCGFITLILVFALFYSFEIIHRFWFGRRSDLSCIDIAMMTCSVPLHQGLFTPSPVSAKVLLSFWWIFCIVITGVYSGNLIAFLTVSRASIPFRTIQDVAEQNTYRVGTYAGSFIHQKLKISNDLDFKSLWNKIELTKVSSSIPMEEEWLIHMARLNRGHYVFLAGETEVDMLMNEDCSLSKIPTDFMPIYSSFVFPKDSPLALLFADELMYMTEHGLMSTWFKMWTQKEKICAQKSQLENMQLTAKDLIGGFLACGAGILLATIVVFAEYMFHMIHKRCRLNSN